MKLSFTRCRHLPAGRLAQELFADGELRVLLSKSGYYLTATQDGVDYFAFPARFGLSPHPAIGHLEAVRFLPEEATVGMAGHYVIGIAESEGRWICPESTISF